MMTISLPFTFLTAFSTTTTRSGLKVLLQGIVQRDIFMLLQDFSAVREISPFDMSFFCRFLFTLFLYAAVTGHISRRFRADYLAPRIPRYRFPRVIAKTSPFL